jgi:hypothetical protein
MFADPQSVTVNSVAQSMPRITSTGLSAVYQKSDLSFKLTISHTPTKDDRIRSMVRIDQRAIVTNPLDSSNDYDTLSFYCVIDRPSYGFTTAQTEQLVAGLQAWLTSGNVDKLLGTES